MNREMLIKLKDIVRIGCRNFKTQWMANEWLLSNGCEILEHWIAVQVLDSSKVMIPAAWKNEDGSTSYVLMPRDLADKILFFGCLPASEEVSA